MIPLYRGELHKVSGVPRQWVIPKTQIPLSVFRNALKKRNAALNEFTQSPAAPTQTTNAHATPVANGTAETSGLASAEGSGELGKHGGSENDDDSTPDDRTENGVGSSGCKPASSTDRSERGEEETERRQERKRRREEDYREETGRGIDRREDFVRRDRGELETPSRGKCKVSHEVAEPMIVDSVDQRVAMDCDVKDEEKTGVDSDETMADVVRVRVSELGTSSEMESKQGDSELGEKATATEAKQKDAGNLRRNGELAQPAATGIAVSSFEETKPVHFRLPTTPGGSATGAGSAELKVINEKVKRKEELEAKLERLRAEKHRFVLRLKQVLNEEEVKKRGSIASGSPAAIQGAVAGPNDSSGVSTREEKHGIGGPHNSGDLEDGELEYARTPSPPLRTASNIHASHSSSLGPLGSLPPPQAPVVGRQTSLSQHLSQTASGRGAYYVPGLGGVPPSQPAPPGISGGAQSPGAGFMGNLPAPLGSHCYSHNLAFQHAAAIHAQKVTSVSHGHGQFSPAPSSGGPLGLAGPPGVVAGGPPGFSGYPMSSSVHSHHNSHLSQPASSSSLPHIVGQQGVNSSSSILTNPRGPPGYHDIRMGGSTWIQR